MPEQLRGISGPEDIQTQEDALRLLDVDRDATPEEISDAMTDLYTDVHPDAGGTAELFQAVQLAEDGLTGETMILASGGRAPDLTQEETRDISITGGPSGGRGRQPPTDDGPFGGGGGTQQDDVRDGPGSGPAGDFGGFGSTGGFQGEDVGFQGVDAEELVNEIKNILREKVGEERLKEAYGDIANLENVSEILAAQVLQGNIDLGDIENMIGGEDVAGSTEAATGGVYSDNPSGPFSGGNDNPFYGSTSDAQYSPGNVDVEDDDGDSES